MFTPQDHEERSWRVNSQEFRCRAVRKSCVFDPGCSVVFPANNSAPCRVHLEDNFGTRLLAVCLDPAQCELGTRGKLATKLPDASQIEAVSRELDKINLPGLQRPAVVASAAATLDLIRWACQFYCFSVLAHFREMLRSFTVLVWNGLIPASFVIARCLFEIAAHSHYTHKHVVQYLDRNDLETAWRFLNDVNMGSRYMQEEYGDKTEEWPRLRHHVRLQR